MINMFQGTVTAVAVQDSGTPTLDFAGGPLLTVPHSDIYEFWELSGDGTRESRGRNTPLLDGTAARHR